MKLYLAAIYSNNFDIGGSLYRRLTDGEKKQRDSASFLLESYHYVHKQKYVEKIRKDKRKIFLDSGAFSAFTKGVEIDLRAYCRYVQENIDILEVVEGQPLFSVLDGIGDPLKTYQNQVAMERLGVRPLPCFHYGEDERYLEWYVANYDYITLGGMVPISTPQVKLWLDRIWEKYLVDGAGHPKIRVHGFGLTTLSLMERYPWFSVDSSSWIQIANNGGLVLLDGRVISVSANSPRRKVDGQHIDTLTPIQRTAVESWLIKMGVDIDRVKKEYYSRWSYCIWAFDQLGKSHFQTDRFVVDQQGLF